ncbi:hypothetical protein BC826DRAFT_1113980 [Russula brevipes]|nr:hypothetical protein BC826DRAFT_1113980 [Russula brevipes]
MPGKAWLEETKQNSEEMYRCASAEAGLWVLGRDAVDGEWSASQVDPQTEVPGTSAPTPTGNVLRNPLTGIFDKRNNTPFVVLDVVPENVSPSAFPHISEPHDDDWGQGPQGDSETGDSNPTETEHDQPVLAHAMATTTLGPASLHKEITNSPQESTQAGTETPELPHTSTEHLVPAQPAPSEHTGANLQSVLPPLDSEEVPTTGDTGTTITPSPVAAPMQPAPSNHTGANLQPVSPPLEEVPMTGDTTIPPSSTAPHQPKVRNTKYSRTRKMQPGSAVTARNICAAEWCASNPNGTVGEFSQYWDILDAQRKMVYKQREKEAKATAAAAAQVAPK